MKSSKLENKDLIRIGPESGWVVVGSHSYSFWISLTGLATHEEEKQHQSLSILPRHPPNIKVSPSLPPEDRQDSSTWKLLETPRCVASTNYGPARAGILGCASRFLIPTGRRTCILIRCVYSILIFGGLKSQPMKITLAHWWIHFLINKSHPWPKTIF